MIPMTRQPLQPRDPARLTPRRPRWAGLVLLGPLALTPACQTNPADADRDAVDRAAADASAQDSARPTAPPRPDASDADTDRALSAAVPELRDTTGPGPPPPGGPFIDEPFSPAQMQQAVRNFADQYRQTIATACDHVIVQDPDPQLRRRAQYTKINGATAMYDIAVDPLPASALLNAAVMVSLQTNFVRVNGQQLFGQYAPMLLQRGEYLQEEIFRLCARVMSNQQRRDLLDMINQWSQQNPDVIDFWYVRLDDLPGVRQGMSVTSVIGNLTNLPGQFLNVFNPFAKAQDSASEASALAERMSWLGPRLMIIAQWRAEAVVYDSIANTRISEALDLGQRFASVAEGLPQTLDQQREALVDTLQENQQTLGDLLAQTQQLTADATTLLQTVDHITGRVQDIQQTALEASADDPPPDPDAPPARPFDITEYTTALQELNTLVTDANVLLKNADSATTAPALQPRVDLIADTARNLILLTAVCVLAVGLLLILALKFIPRRQPRTA